MEKLKVYAIETNNGVYISRDPDNPRYGQSNYSTHLFDGVEPQGTFASGWSKINNPPKRVSHIEHRPNINHRFILIDDSLDCDRIPKELTREQAGEQINCSTFQWKPEYDIYKSLYLAVSDEQPPIEADDEFEYIVLANIDDVKEPKKISYPFKETGVYGQSGNVSNENVKHSIIDQIVYPALTIHERPCRLTSKQTYDIVREHIKLNINPKVAKITSDYDFCVTVEKIIPIAKPYSYQYDANKSIFGRKRKPEMKERWVGDKKIVCFEMTSVEDDYKGYTPIKPFEGKSEDDLKEQIDLYLEALMAYINEPMKECPHCDGAGVLFNNEVEPVTAKR